jgi:peroxiredoxin Q/BCP
MIRHCGVFITVMLICIFVLGCEDKPGITAESMEEAGASRSHAVGEPAPPFTLMDQDNQPVSLSDYRGQWVVLYFYPKDDTPGCICQATEFTELLFRFQDMNAKVLGVSADDVATHKNFTKKHELKLTLLSDPDQKVMGQYGTSVKNAWGSRTILRQTFIIDPDGVIRRHWQEVIPKGHAKRVREKLAELQAARGRP